VLCPNLTDGARQAMKTISITELHERTGAWVRKAVELGDFGQAMRASRVSLAGELTVRR